MGSFTSRAAEKQLCFYRWTIGSHANASRVLWGEAVQHAGHLSGDKQIFTTFTGTEVQATSGVPMGYMIHH